MARTKGSWKAVNVERLTKAEKDAIAKSHKTQQEAKKIKIEGADKSIFDRIQKAGKIPAGMQPRSFINQDGVYHIAFFPLPKSKTGAGGFDWEAEDSEGSPI